jgi:hypothetical protein
LSALFHAGKRSLSGFSKLVTGISKQGIDIVPGAKGVAEKTFVHICLSRAP